MTHCVYLTMFLQFAIVLFALNQELLVNAQNKTEINETLKEEDIFKQALTKKNLKFLKKVGNIVENVGVFMPQVSMAFKSTNAVWNILTITRSLVTSDQLEDKTDTDRIRELSETSKRIEQNLHIINDKVDKLAETIGKENIVDGILKTIFTNVQTVYSYFIELSHLVNDNNTKKISNFCQSIIDPATGILKHIRDIYSAINADNKKFFTFLRDTKQVEEMMCKNKRPTMHLLYDIYGSITLTEVKALLILQYAGNFTNDPDIGVYQKGMRMRLTNLRREIQSVMSVAVKDFWACEGDGIEGVDYGKLSPIFSLHITRESEMMEVLGSLNSYHNGQSHRYTFTSCKSYSLEFPTGVAYDSGSTELAREFGIYQSCAGVLRNCDLYADLREDITICIAEPGSGRKYNKVKIKDVTHGSDDFCKNKKTLEGAYFSGQGYNDLCMCICDEYYIKNHTHRYFNLKPVTSDIQRNKVITGARIALKDQMFQLEIQEGKLMSNGNINQRTLRWKGNSFNITDSGITESVDYHRITWDQNKINLDELKAPNGTLLTGLKFELDNGILKLAIGYTQFNFKSGKLLKDNSSEWMSESNDKPNRIGSVILNTNVPTSSARHRPSKYKTGYLHFNISSIETDVGQNVVPYIDLQSLTLNPPIPFSGASLIHKSSLNDAGYLALKLTTYDYALELPSDETWNS